MLIRCHTQQNKHKKHKAVYCICNIGFFNMQKLKNYIESTLILFALTSIIVSKDIAKMNRKSDGL